MFKNDKQRSPSQKAQRAQLGIFVRLAGCGYLIYIMVKLLQTPSEDAAMSPTTVTIIAVVMIALSVFIIAITIREFIFGLKNGHYKTASYEEADLNDYLNNRAAEDQSDVDPELIGTGDDDEDDSEDDAEDEDDDIEDNDPDSKDTP